MARIQRLSQNLINKIAAGEVIERPGSVVKELMENSIDAGASRIDAVIERGGSQLIRIVDNGCGMDAEDLILAVTSHATSKLRSENDLFSVSSMGFRGEAMASVAEISQMTVRSRVNPGVKPTVGEAAAKTAESAAEGEEICGMELRVEGGDYQEPTPCGCPPGTQIDVRNLFFNTPVRRKFLKSLQTEFGYISEYFVRLALANPQIHFTLKHNARMVYDLPAVTDWLQRICAIEGKELADALLYIEKEFAGIRIHGYAARPNYSRSNAKMQFLFLNGRPIRDRALQHALLEAYRGLLTQNRYPICFLKIEMPPEMVDVNVHPTKMEVRFQDSNNIYGQFLAALRSKFLTTNMATFVTQPARSPGDPLPSLTETFRNIDSPERNDSPSFPPSDRENAPGTLEETQTPEYAGSSASRRLPWLADAAREQEEIAGTAGTAGTAGPSVQPQELSVRANPFGEAVPPFKPFEDLTPGTSLSSKSADGGGFGNRSVSRTLAAPGNADSFGVRQPRRSFTEDSAGTFSSGPPAVYGPETSPCGTETQACDPHPAGGSAPAETSGIQTPLLGRKILQIHQRYIVTQCPEGLMVVDQHAMHERILYERLKKRLKSMSIEVQQLLVPEAVDLRPAEAAMILERREQLESMGILVESFGGNTILVHALPAMLFTFEKKDRLRADELLHEILEVIQSGSGELALEKFIDDTLHTIACKAACKAGQPLSYDEMQKLLDEYQNCPEADHCPHGRPSVLIWTCAELDKLFCRIL